MEDLDIEEQETFVAADHVLDNPASTREDTAAAGSLIHILVEDWVEDFYQKGE